MTLKQKSVRKKNINNWIIIYLFFLLEIDQLSANLRKYKIQTRFTYDKKIENILSNPKTKIELEYQVMYDVPCKHRQTNRRANI